MDTRLEKLLEFWLGSAKPEEMLNHRQEWWIKSPEFDQRISEEFFDLFEEAISGKLEDWKDSPLGCVGLCILLDQFPRNMFRGQARAFEYDETARNITSHVLEQEFYRMVPMGAKLFMYLPLEHSEDIDDQNACVALMEAMGDENYLNFAIKHQEVIKKFGRFPHRNAALGRENTPEEEAYLAEPGAGF